MIPAAATVPRPRRLDWRNISARKTALLSYKTREASRELPRDPELEELDLASYQEQRAAHCLDPHFQLSATQSIRESEEDTTERRRRRGRRTIARLFAAEMVRLRGALRS